MTVIPFVYLPIMAGRLTSVYATLYPHEVFHSYAAASHYSPFRARLGLRQSEKHEFHKNAQKAYNQLMTDACRGKDVTNTLNRLEEMTVCFMRQQMYDADLSKLIKLVEDPVTPDAQ